MSRKKIKSLADFKDEIHRCSKCGLCQAVCPIYKTTGNECSVSRGLFIMLEGVLSGRLKMSKKINKYLDLCLKCNKCFNYCPSEIDVVDILITAKNEYFRTSFWGKIYSFLESKIIFNSVLNFVKFFTNMFHKNKKSQKYETKAVYFGGCVSALSPDTNDFVLKILNKMRIEVLDMDYKCCGMPFYTTGNLDRFKENLKENILKIPEGATLLITDCASCEQMWKQYIKYIDDETLREKYSKIKIKNIYELIDKNELKFTSTKKRKVTYHKPCHEEHADHVLNIIKDIGNVEYVELSGMDECCGFGGYEHLSTVKPTAAIRENKKENIKSSTADTVLSSCVGCILSLKLMRLKKETKRLIDFLKDSCEIK